MRIVGTFGMAVLFLLISPKLREYLLGYLETATNALTRYSPFSYVGLALVFIGLALTCVGRNSAQR